MNANQPPLKPVMDLLAHVRENRVLQISGQPRFSVQSALNILSGLDTEHTLTTRSTTRTEKIKQMLGWAPDPQYSVLRGIDEAALNWAHNEGYFDQALHVHVAPPVPDNLDPVHIEKQVLVVHSHAHGGFATVPHNASGCERILMLYIQAAHEQLIRDPIVLSQTGLSLNNEHNINEWGLAVPSSGMDIGSFILRKTFSEAYASLVLMVGEQGSEHAQTAIRTLMERNHALQSVWDGERDIVEHYMGPETLQMVLEQWSHLAKSSAEEARAWVRSVVGSEFGGWLNNQPLAEIVVGEMVPNFEKRLIDMARREGRFVQNIASTSPLKEHLDAACAYLQSQWDSAPLTGHGVVHLLHRTIQRTGLAVEWMVNHDPILKPISQRFERERAQVCSGVVAELQGVTPSSSLSARLEQYRKGTTIEPYVLPPIP